MAVRLTVTAGPHLGREFAFDRHDTFLVGRSKDAHLQLSADDPYFSRRHFLVEVNPPRCRVIDLGSRNGVTVNGTKVLTTELRDGDEIKAGHTVFRLRIEQPDPDAVLTIGLPATASSTIDHEPGGTDIPGYRVEQELGRGAMGVVHRAVRLADGTPVAMKTISASEDVTSKQVERFLREARVMAGLTHPHIARYIDSGRTGARIYLVMELVDGPDAGRILKRNGPLPVPTGVRIACQVLSALGHAHAMGIVHRDVKPANVLVGGPKGKRAAKLADFGLARAYDDCRLSGLTFQGEVGGTPAFMAPEQVTHYRDVKPAADQYAAGATLYALLTGAHPHDLSKDVGKQLVQLITAEPVPIRTRRPDLPPGLAEVIHRALAREPAGRFPDVAAFRTALLPFAT